jgi:tetratricopeptide (TPR) repeat protein
VTDQLIRTLPTPDKMTEAIVKLIVEYPREMDVLIDESAIRKYTECCFEFHLIKRPKSEARVRIPEGQTVSSLSPLELLSQYFEASKIEESGELHKTQVRHCLHFVAVAERARAALGTDQQNSRLRELDADRENVLAAFNASRRVPSEENAGFRLMQALRFYLIRRGMPSAVLGMCGELLLRDEHLERTKLRCQVLFSAGQACSFMARYAEARTYLQESLSIARELNEPNTVEATLQPLGIAFLGDQDFERARDCFIEALDLAIRTGNQRERVAVLCNLGMLYRTQGNLDEAAKAYQEALDVARLQKEEESIAIVLLNLAMTNVLSGNPPKAREMLREVVDIAARTGSVAVLQSAVEAFSGLAACEGDWRTAARLHGFTEAQATRTGMRRDPADEAYVSSCIGRARAEAQGEFDAIERLGRSLAAEVALDEVRRSLAAGGKPITSC